MESKAKRTRKASKQTEWTVRLRIICVAPPDPAEYGASFGLQDNSTTKEWVIHKGELHPNRDVHFACECRVRQNPATGKPNFLGPFVHGPTTDRFLYLSWRPQDWRPGGPEVASGTWLRRMKIRLGTIPWAQVRPVEDEGGVLEIKVEGTGPSGPFGSADLNGKGWKRARD